MASIEASAPLPTPLPEAPSGDYWSEAQWEVLFALADAVLPSIVPESAATDKPNQMTVSDEQFEEIFERVQATMTEAPDKETFKKYFAERPSASPDFRANMRRSLGSVTARARSQLGGVLNRLSTRYGALLLTRYFTPVHEQPVEVREAILKAWSKSWLPGLDTLSMSVAKLAQVAWVQTSPLFKEVTGYPDVPANWKPGRHHEYAFLQFEAGPEPAVLETDIVIVGSGCGGAVSAKVLAEAGHRVLVVDKGYYFPPAQLPMSQELGCHYLFENGGILASDNNSMSVLAGSCWGGGGTVNWSVSLETQGYVRDEWAGPEHGLAFFKTQAFKDCLDRVCAFMGVSDQGVRQSHRGARLLEGADRLGWQAKVTPQNSGRTEHWCGHCHLGCASAQKHGTVVSWLPAAQRAGAEFIEGLEVQSVIFDETDGVRKATGVRGRWTSKDRDGGVGTSLDARTTRDVVVKAKKVIVSSGTLQSPLLLMRSGLTNRHIGRNLHLHPTGLVAGWWPEDVRGWEGGIITSVSGEFEKLDGKAHGVKLETMCMIPYLNLANMQWRGGLDYKLAALRYRHMNTFIALTRDRDTGRVYPDPIKGTPCIEYSLSNFDRRHTLAGVLALAQICYITGATEIRVNIPGTEPFFRKTPVPKPSAAPGEVGLEPDTIDLGVTEPVFKAWLDSIEKIGNGPPASFGSAHQMGTCRMSSHDGAGVVDPRGRAWGTEDLYVADASVFPSASGVNPMITTMAIADWIARGVDRDMKSTSSN